VPDGYAFQAKLTDDQRPILTEAQADLLMIRCLYVCMQWPWIAQPSDTLPKSSIWRS